MSQNAHETVRSATREVAGLIAPVLEKRLSSLYAMQWSNDWLGAVNAQRTTSGLRPGRGLHDHRFCLAVFGHEAGTKGWADERWRRLARELHTLGNRAAHDEPLADQDAERAVAIADMFRAEHDAVEGRGPASRPYAPHETSPKSSDIARDLAARFQEQRRESAAAKERWFTAAHRWITTAPDDEDARHSYAGALLATAHEQQRTERANRLLAFLDHSWPDSDHDPRAMFYRAAAMVCLDRFDEAVALAREVTRIDDSIRGAWSLLAWTSTMALGDYETGAMAAQRLLHNDPNHFWAKYMLSEALSGMGRHEEAAAVYGEGQDES